MKGDGPAAHAPPGQSLVSGGREVSSVSVASTDTIGWTRDSPSHWIEYRFRGERNDRRPGAGHAGRFCEQCSKLT